MCWNVADELRSLVVMLKCLRLARASLASSLSTYTVWLVRQGKALRRSECGMRSNVADELHSWVLMLK